MVCRYPDSGSFGTGRQAGRVTTAIKHMASFQRVIGGRAVRHAVVESPAHKADVEENNRRRGVYWLGVEEKIEDGHREVPELGGGVYFVRNRESGALDEVGGDELITRMDQWVADKSWYLREIKDPKCKGGKRWKKTPAKGVQGFVVTASPWYSNLIFEAARNGEADKVKELSRQCALELRNVFEKQTRRQVLSVQAHYDSVNLHWHIFATRIGDDHKFLPGSRKRIGLIGPWAVGTLRQVEAGAIPAGSTNYLAAQRLYARNEQRTGEPPLDWIMCKAVDSLCYTMFGASPRLAFWQRVYMQGLPALCFSRLLALRDAVSREVQTWQQHAARSRDYAPSEVGFGRGVNGGREIRMK
jgi:hypothetical protein